jgi:hypothetical protein
LPCQFLAESNPNSDYSYLNSDTELNKLVDGNYIAVAIRREYLQFYVCRPSAYAGNKTGEHLIVDITYKYIYIYRVLRKKNVVAMVFMLLKHKIIHVCVAYDLPSTLYMYK